MQNGKKKKLTDLKILFLDLKIWRCLWYYNIVVIKRTHSETNLPVLNLPGSATY